MATTKNTIKREATARFAILRETRNAYLLLLEQTITDLLRLHENEEFCFENPKDLKIVNPYDTDVDYFIQSVFEYNRTVYVNCATADGSKTDKLNINRLSYEMEYTLAASLAQTTYGGGYRGEWVAMEIEPE